MVIDGATVITGRLNFTKAAETSNAENLLVILSPELAAKYPAQGDMQLFRLAAATEFNCSRCQSTKSAKLVAVVAGDWNRLLCNGCYGKLLSEG